MISYLQIGKGILRFNRVIANAKNVFVKPSKIFNLNKLNLLVRLSGFFLSTRFCALYRSERLWKENWDQN